MSLFLLLYSNCRAPCSEGKTCCNGVCITETTTSFCCQNQLCSTHCIKVTHKYEEGFTYQCISNSLYDKCVAWEGRFFVILGCFLIPSIVFAIISIFSPRKPPIFNLFLDILTNVLLSFIVSGSSCINLMYDPMKSLFLLGLYFWPIAVTFQLLSSFGLTLGISKRKAGSVFEEIKFFSTDNFLAVGHSNRTAVPALFETAESYHTSGIRKYVASTSTKAVPFLSWEDVSPPPMAPVDSNVFITTFEIRRDREIDAAGTVRKAAINGLEKDDNVISVQATDKIIGFIRGAANHWLATGCGRFLYLILSMFGYKYVIETVWMMTTTICRDKVIKVVSATGNYQNIVEQFEEFSESSTSTEEKPPSKPSRIANEANSDQEANYHTALLETEQ